MAVQPSQQEEETLVREFFSGATNGFFVEVGANHPIQRSQSYHLEQTGWSGVLIEPQPDLAAFLVTERRAKVFAVACTSPTAAGSTLPFHVAGPLSSLNADRMAPGAKADYVIMVPTRTLDDVLEEADAPRGFDLLSIDVEGHEIEVMRGFDFGHWKPRLIMLEDHVENLKKHRVLEQNGYSLVRRVGNNGWYVPRDVKIDVPLRDRWEILRKYHLALPFRALRNLSRRIRRSFKDVAAGR